MTTLRDIPAIQAESERLAREFLGSADAAFRAAGWDTDTIHGGEDYTEDALRLFAAAHLDLLTDLTRPASRDAVARLVAAKVPGLQAWEVIAGCSVYGPSMDVVMNWCGVPIGTRPTADNFDPATALSLIAIAVLGDSDV